MRVGQGTGSKGGVLGSDASGGRERSAGDVLRQGHGRPLAVVQSPALEARAPGRVFLGLECLQVTGSYHVRGALWVVAHAQAGPLVVPATGRHAIAMAYAAAVFDRPCSVVMAEDAPGPFLERARTYGAHVELVPVPMRAPESIAVLESAARTRAAATGAVLVPPTEPRLAVGTAASLVEDIKAAFPAWPSAVLVPSRRGVLPAALRAAFDRCDASAVRVVTVRVVREGEGLEASLGAAEPTMSVSEAAAAEGARALETTTGVPLEPPAAAAAARARAGLPAGLAEGDILALVPARSIVGPGLARASLPPRVAGLGRRS